MRRHLEWVYPVILGVFFGVCRTLANSFEQTDSSKLIRDDLALFCVVTLAESLLLAAFFASCFLLVDVVCHNHTEGEEDPLTRLSSLLGLSNPEAHARGFLTCWLVLVLFWLPYFVSLAPGSSDSDTITQFFQMIGAIEPSDHHPWFDTMIFGAFWRFGKACFGSYAAGECLYVGIQMLAMSAGFSYLVQRMGSWGVKNRIRCGTLLFCALFPPFPLFALVMVKDSLNAIFWVPWLIMFCDIVIHRSCPSTARHWWLGFAVLTVLCCLTKKTSLFLVVPSLVLLALLVRGHTLRTRCLSVALVALLVSLAWPRVIQRIWDVPQASSGEMVSIPAQQVARYCLYCDVTPQEEEAIQRVFIVGSSELAELYVPRRSDRVKARWRSDVDLSDLMVFSRAYLGMLCKQPGLFFAATFNNTYDYFYPGQTLNFNLGPTCDDEYLGHWHGMCRENVSPEEMSAHLDDFRAARAQLQERNPLITRAFNTLRTMPVFRVLLSEAPWCTWIPFFVAAYLIRGNRKSMLMALVPSFLLLLSLIAGPIALVRYVTPAVLEAPILLALPFANRDAA